MAQRQHVIELNGQKYDALTGKLLGATSANAAQYVSDVARPKQPRTSPTAKTVHHKTQKSQTLMRTVVKKPAKAHTLHAKAAPIAKPAAGNLGGVIKPVQKFHQHTISQPRAIRAQHVNQSNLVSKFAAKPVTKVQSAVVPVAAAPVVAADSHRPQPQPIASDATLIFNQALANATSHFEPQQKTPGRLSRTAGRFNISSRALGFASASLVLVIVGSLVAYQSMPVVSMQIASSRAGVRANLPEYRPSGFSMAGPIAYKPGEVSIDYKSNSDDRNFQVVQRSSNWNSQALLENFISANYKSYQTIQSNGRTIYVYDNGSASWVDGGIWYQINGSATLSSDQLLNLARSL